MEGLQAEKKKREKELELLRQSEPKLLRELSNIRETMQKMRTEMQGFQDIDGLRRAFDNTQAKLTELRQSYIKRRDTMRQQVIFLSLGGWSVSSSCPRLSCVVIRS
jgi:septal ring factor EnvC (AmiA/AmiB activator)